LRVLSTELQFRGNRMVSFYMCLGYQGEATLPRAQLSIAVYKQTAVRLAAVRCVESVSKLAEWKIPSDTRWHSAGCYSNVLRSVDGLTCLESRILSEVLLQQLWTRAGCKNRSRRGSFRRTECVAVAL
jgi:hypothetical protein